MIGCFIIMTNKIIHINKNIIQFNAKHGTTFPVCRVEEGKKVTYCMEVEIYGPSKMVYRPECARECGAKLWIETDSEIRMLYPKTYAQFREMKATMKEKGLL